MDATFHQNRGFREAAPDALAHRNPRSAPLRRPVDLGRRDRPALAAHAAGKARRTCALSWFLGEKAHASCDAAALAAFFSYLGRGHKEPGGRWGNPHQRQPLSVGTVKTYYQWLKSFFSFLVEEGYASASPMERIPTPIDRLDQVQPFTDEEVRALLLAAKRSTQPRRDEAILLFLLDTGVRASELCDMRLRHVSLAG